MNLTREQILSLTPGIATDALVAELVFGWCDIGPDERTSMYLLGRRKPGSPREVVPPYSTRIESAWRVVDELALRGFHLSLSDHRDEEDPLWPWVAHFWTNDAHTTSDGVGQTPSQAICLAAMLAIRERSP